jgi:hypothetical protein
MSDRMMSQAPGLGPEQKICWIDESFIGLQGVKGDFPARARAERWRIRHAGHVAQLLLVQTTLQRNSFCGHVYVFRGWHGDSIKVLRFDAPGLMPLPGTALTRRPRRLDD